MSLKTKSNNITSFIWGMFIIVYAIIVESETKLSFSLDYHTILFFIGTSLILSSLLIVKDTTYTIAILIKMTPLIYLLLFLSENQIPLRYVNLILSLITLLLICAGISVVVEDIMINHYYSIYKEDTTNLGLIIELKERIK